MVEQHIREEQFFRYNPDDFDHTFAGMPVTDELLDSLADIAEAPVEESHEMMRQLKFGLTPGGKSLSGDGKHSPRFTVVLGEKTADLARQAAAEKGMSVSKWMRRIIEHEVA